MITYKSTRGIDNKSYSFSEAILKGIADDGGLLSPSKLPQFSLEQLKILADKSYQERALFIFSLFKMDLPEKVLQRIVYEAYSTNFDNQKIAPVIYLKDNQYVLELWHGPTLAFKDIALQIMPLFFLEAIKLDNKKRVQKGMESLRYLILVATSGDTGKAALEGYKNRDGIYIMVFFPDGRVSALQELQMVTQDGNNVSVCALKGDFDAVQQTVKEIFNDEDFNQSLLKKYNFSLSSANSINWGRLLPQVVYYVSSYIDLVQKGIIQWEEFIDVCVPTGNFGNILAAFYAKKMGLPIRKLICASNQNNVLTDFLQKGIYDISKRSLVKTSSPSMDILIASNVERLLSSITNDVQKVRLWMQDLQEKKKFVVDKETRKILQNEFYADWVFNEESLNNINQVYRDTKYLIDPHTSVAQVVAERYASKHDGNVPILICSTAHWAKFAKNVYQAIVSSDPKPAVDEFEMLLGISSTSNVSIPKRIEELKVKPILYKQKCKPDRQAVEELVLDWIQE